MQLVQNPLCCTQNCRFFADARRSFSLRNFERATNAYRERKSWNPGLYVYAVVISNKNNCGVAAICITQGRRKEEREKGREKGASPRNAFNVHRRLFVNTRRGRFMHYATTRADFLLYRMAGERLHSALFPPPPSLSVLSTLPWLIEFWFDRIDCFARDFFSEMGWGRGDWMMYCRGARPFLMNCWPGFQVLARGWLRDRDLFWGLLRNGLLFSLDFWSALASLALDIQPRSMRDPL